MKIPSKLRTPLLLAFVVGLSACTDRSAHRADTQGAIESMYAQRLQSFQSAPSPAEMADAYVADVALDAVWMVQNSTPVEGQAAIRDWAVEFFGSYELVISSQTIEPLEIGPEIAIRRFTSAGEYVNRSTQARYPFDQKYVDVLQRQQDGSWKLTLHMWGSNNSGQSIW